MPTTHQPCWRDGVYKSSCCGSEITLKKDASVPKCHGCGEVTGWTPVRFIEADHSGIRVDPSPRKQRRPARGNGTRLRNRHLAAPTRLARR
jgi:hypothetical protein